MTARMTAADLVNSVNAGARGRRVDRESPIHKAILGHIRRVLPEGTIIHHSPNSIGLSGALIMRQIAHNEAMGTVKGFPDLLCLLPGPRVWMFEVKAAGNYPDADQRALHDRLRALGCRVAVVRSTADADAAITEWSSEGDGSWRRNDFTALRDRIVGGGDE